MNRAHRAWNRVAVLLLLLGVGSEATLADSPQWADEEMLLPWPVALGGAAHTAASEPATLPWGHSSFVEATGRDVESAAWSVTPSSAASQPPSTRPTSAFDLVKTKHTAPLACDNCDVWQFLPAGVLYGSYLAGEKEPRMAAAYLSERDLGSIFEGTLGGRLGLVRHGSLGPINPQGWQWDLEAAAMLRQNIDQELDVEATDFRFGTVITRRRGNTAVKAGYYHLSSHLGDEFLIRNPMFPRLNYVRDSVLIGVYHNLRADLAVYGEIAYAFNTDGGAEPLELQFGTEYTPFDPARSGGSPFVAINGHLREEFNFGGSVNILAGWQWRGRVSNRRFRVGGQYYNGKEIQWSFFDESVEFVGLGVWFDF